MIYYSIEDRTEACGQFYRNYDCAKAIESIYNKKYQDEQVSRQYDK